MRIKKSFIFISLLLLLCISLGVSSAADISIDDISTTDNTPSMSIIQDNPGHKEIIIPNQQEKILTPKEYNLNQPNTNNNSMKFVFYNISCENDFKNISNQLTNSSIIVVNITNNIKTTHEGFSLNFNCKNKTLIILGNNFNINVRKPNPHCENHFLNCGDSSTVLMSNMKISGFNTAIINQGKCSFENIIFNSNKVDYNYMKDYGGAIKNFGVMDCYNCSFINNYAKYGGAIYSNGSFSNMKLFDCIFKKNTAYADEYGDSGYMKYIHIPFHNKVKDDDEAVMEKNGDDIFVGEYGSVCVYNLLNETPLYSSIDFGYDNTKPIITNRISYNPIVREYVVNNPNSLKKASADIYNTRGDVDIFIVNVTKDVDFKPWSENMNAFHPQYGSVIINGNGHQINILNTKEDEEYHFAYINKTNLRVNSLRISGFNCAIMNYGSCVFYDCCFVNNHVKYPFSSGDEAGAIKNMGLLSCINCTFQDNKGNWAGAIYSENGAITNLTKCTFKNNIHCKDFDGADLYNFNHANYIIDGSNITKDSNFTNVTIDYGYPPSGWKKAGYLIIKVATWIISTYVGYAGAFLGGFSGLIMGTVLGTALGTGLDLINDAKYYDSMHNFNGFSACQIFLNVWEHLTCAYIGANIGLTSFYPNFRLKLVKQGKNPMYNKGYGKEITGEPGNRVEINYGSAAYTAKKFKIETYEQPRTTYINGEKYHILQFQKYAADDTININQYTCLNQYGEYVTISLDEVPKVELEGLYLSVLPDPEYMIPNKIAKNDPIFFLD